MKSTLLFIVFVLSLLLYKVDAFGENVESSSYSVVDYLGRSITLNKSATRIVALAPHIVENIYSAGAGDLIVGATEYSDYPKEALTIPRIGLSHGVSIETILSLNPDLVITWSSGLSSRKLKKLNDFGIPIYFDEPKKLGDIAKSIRDIGVLTNRTISANLAAQEFLKQLFFLEKRFSHQNKQILVFYQVWDDPLQTLNKDSIVSDVIELCGGINIFADEKVIAPIVSLESVIEQNPDAIVTSDRGVSFPDSLERWKKWGSMSAVKHKNLFYIHPDLLLRHTVRLLEGAYQLCLKFENLNLKEK